MEIRIGIGAWGVAIAAVAAAGCGGGEAAWGPVIGGNQPPVIEHLSIEHDDPAAPGRVLALAEVHDPDGDEVEVRFAWEVAGVARPETGPELSLPSARKGTRIEVTAIATDLRAQSEPALRVVHARNPRAEIVSDRWGPAHDAQDWGAGSAVFALGDDPLSGGGPDGQRTAERNSMREHQFEGTGEALRYAVETPQAEGASRIRFRMLLGPEGMWVHPASGEVTWVPAAWQTDTYPVEVEVTDASGAVMVEEFNVNAGIEEPEPSLPAKLAAP